MRKGLPIGGTTFCGLLTLGILHVHRDLRDNLLLDAAWQLLHLYVASFVMALICNAANPPTVCFGLQRTVGSMKVIQGVQQKV
jgi:hypothetical protein